MSPSSAWKLLERTYMLIPSVSVRSLGNLVGRFTLVYLRCYIILMGLTYLYDDFEGS